MGGNRQIHFCVPPEFHEGGIKMRLWEGKGAQELLERLKELDSLTSIDSIIRPKQKVTITATAYGSGMGHWKISADEEAYNALKIASGNKFDRFCEAFETLSEDTDMDIYSVRVLAYAESSAYKTYDGMYTVRWFSIDPLAPYETNKKTGQPVFRFEELDVTEEEFKMLMNTKLAIRSGENVYALSRDALASAGRLLLDSSAVFKHSEENALSCGLMFAEALAGRDSLKAMTRRTGGTVQQLLAFMGGRYRHIPQEDFFREVLRNAAGIGIYRVEQWSVTDEVTSVEILFPEESGFQKGFFVTASDFSGAPMKAVAFGRFPNGSEAVLRQSSMFHNKSSAEKGVEQMFNGMEDAFAEFDRFVEDMDQDIVFYAKDYPARMKAIRSLVGMRRFREPEPVTCNGIDLAMELLEIFDADIRDRSDLLEHVWKLLLDIREGTQKDSRKALRA